jgi:hypothetical protein
MKSKSIPVAMACLANFNANAGLPVGLPLLMLPPT